MRDKNEGKRESKKCIVAWHAHKRALIIDIFIFIIESNTRLLISIVNFILIKKMFN